MAMENVLIRVANLTLGASSYSFSLLVGVFVLSLACGSFLVAGLRWLPCGLLLVTQAIALVGWCLVFVTLDEWPYVAHLVRAAFQGNAIGFWLHQAAVFLCLLAVLLVPVGLLGVSIPVIFHEVKVDLNLVGWHSGRILSANAVGCVIGSVAGGWLLYYPLNNSGVFTVALSLIALTAALASWPFGKVARLGAVGLFGVVVLWAGRGAGFDQNRFAHGTFGLEEMTPFSYRGPAYFHEHFQRDRTVKFYDDSPSGTAAVIADHATAFAAPEFTLLPPGMPAFDPAPSEPTNPPLDVTPDPEPWSEIVAPPAWRDGGMACGGAVSAGASGYFHANRWPGQCNGRHPNAAGLAGRIHRSAIHQLDSGVERAAGSGSRGELDRGIHRSFPFGSQPQ